MSAGVDHVITGVAFSTLIRSEERFSRNAETDIVCRLLLEKKAVSAYDPSGVSGSVGGRGRKRWPGQCLEERARFGPFPFFFNDTPPTEIYTLPLHPALPI